MKYVFFALGIVSFLSCQPTRESISRDSDFSLKTYEESNRAYQTNWNSVAVQNQTEVLRNGRFYSYADFMKLGGFDSAKKVKIIKDSTALAAYKRDIKSLILVE